MEANTFLEMINGPKPVLVDFSAEWCAPFKIMTTVLSELKKNVGDVITIFEVDVDRNRAAAAAYQIDGVPTLILFKNGSVLWKHSGIAPINYIRQIIQTHLGIN